MTQTQSLRCCWRQRPISYSMIPHGHQSRRHVTGSCSWSEHRNDANPILPLANASTLCETLALDVVVSCHPYTRRLLRPVIVSTKTLVKLPVLTASKSMIVTYMRDDVMAFGTRNFWLRYPNILPRIAVNVGLAGLKEDQSCAALVPLYWLWF
jgi:hypothetical protein